MSIARKEEIAATRYYNALKAGKITAAMQAANAARIQADIAEGRRLMEADQRARAAVGATSSTLGKAAGEKE